MLAKIAIISIICLSLTPSSALAQCPDCTIPIPRPPVSGTPSCQDQAIRVYRAEAKTIGRSKAEFNYRKTISKCRKIATQSFPVR